MEQIKFTYNWNNKLDCNFFTTIRLQSKKFEKNKNFEIVLKNQVHCKVVIVDMWICKINDLKDFVCYLDTGYNNKETINMFKKMYSGVDFTQTNMVLLLLKKV